MSAKLDWAVRKVLECAYISPEKATPLEIDLAEAALAQAYYIDRAARLLLSWLRYDKV